MIMSEFSEGPPILLLHDFSLVCLFLFYRKNLTPLRRYCWCCSRKWFLTDRDHMICQRLNPGQLLARHIPYPLCYHCGPDYSLSYAKKTFRSQQGLLRFPISGIYPVKNFFHLQGRGIPCGAQKLLLALKTRIPLGRLVRPYRIWGVEH